MPHTTKKSTKDQEQRKDDDGRCVTKNGGRKQGTLLLDLQGFLSCLCRNPWIPQDRTHISEDLIGTGDVAVIVLSFYCIIFNYFKGFWSDGFLESYEQWYPTYPKPHHYFSVVKCTSVNSVIQHIYFYLVRPIVTILQTSSLCPWWIWKLNFVNKECGVQLLYKTQCSNPPSHFSFLKILSIVSSIKMTSRDRI